MDRQVELGKPHTRSAETNWTELVQIVADELVDGMKWQSRKYPGFTCETSANPDDYVVHGVLDVKDLAARVINELISLT